MKIFDTILLCISLAFIARMLFGKENSLFRLSTVIPALLYVIQDLIISNLLSACILYYVLDGDFQRVSFFSAILYVGLIPVFCLIIFAIRRIHDMSSFIFLRHILNYGYILADTLVFGYLVTKYAMPGMSIGWTVFAYTVSFILSNMAGRIIQNSMY